MAPTRRDFLVSSAGLAVAALAPVAQMACGRAAGPRAIESPGERMAPFLHGVASGDPLADRVILWTRVTPPPGHQGPLEVRWEIAKDPGMREIVGRGRAAGHPDRDYTVKVDAPSLAPGGTWYYRFDALGQASPVGRARTLPVGRVEQLRLGVASCSSYPTGYFNAYASLAAREELDAVLHLGDYIYEAGRDDPYGGSTLGRDSLPVHEIVSLADYRARYAQHRTDPDLQLLHRQHAFIAVWDDHEIANNAWRTGAENHQPESEGSYAARRAAAVRAYFEWMPIRESGPDRIYRSFRYGDLADLIMLDTRLIGRDAPPQAEDKGMVVGLEHIADDPRRTLLGAAQEAWLEQELQRSQQAGTRWRLLGQQTMLAKRSRPGEYMNGDAWDGYRASRTRLLDQIGPAGVPDVVTLTGDYHSAWAMEVAHDSFDERRYRPGTGEGSLGVEFVAPAISATPAGHISGNPAEFAAEALADPHVQYADGAHNGYMLVDVDRKHTRASWFFERDVTRPVPDEFAGPDLRHGARSPPSRGGALGDPGAQPAPRRRPADAGLPQARVRNAERRRHVRLPLPRRRARALPRPGRWQAVTSHELASRTELSERWVREWLQGLGAAGILDYQGDGRFSLSPAGNAILADEDSPAFGLGLFTKLPRQIGALDQIAESFRTGIGLPYDAFGNQGARGTERGLRPWYRHSLIQEALPQLDGVVEKLERGARVADVGCGDGQRRWSRWPRAFPALRAPRLRALPARAGSGPRPTGYLAGLDEPRPFTTCDSEPLPADAQLRPRDDLRLSSRHDAAGPDDRRAIRGCAARPTVPG